MPSAANSAGIAYEAFLIFNDSPRSEVAISDDVLGITINRELAGFNRPLRAGDATVTLFNADGQYSPRRLDSPFNGELRPNLQVRIQGTVTSGSPFILNISHLNCGNTLSQAKVLFTGFVDNITVQPALNGPRNAVFQCRDEMKELVRRRVTTDILTNVNVTSAFTTIMSLAGIPADQRSIAAIDDRRNFIWYRDVLLITALDEMVESGAYNLFVSADGTVSVKNRLFEFGQDIVASYENMRSLSFTVSEREIFNDISVRGFPRAVANSVQVVANIIEPITIPGSSSIGFFLDYLDPRNQEPAPAINMQTLVASQDYLTFTNSDGTGTNRTNTTTVSVVFFGETAVQTISNLNSEDIFLTKYQLRGDPILRFPSIRVRREATESQSLFGIKERSIENRLLARRSEITELADFLVGVYSDPTDEVSFSLTNQFPDVFNNELTDIVRLVNTHTGIDGEFTIKGVRHNIQADQVGWVHEAEYDLLQSLAFDTLILDSSASGVLDTNRLGRNANPAPSTLLNGLRAYWRLDTSSTMWVDSRKQNHLTSVNSVETTTGVLSNAALFNASSQQYLIHPDNIDLRATQTSSGFTVAMWPFLASKGGDRHLVNKHTTCNTLTFFLLDDADYGILDTSQLGCEPDLEGEYYVAYANTIDRYVFGITDDEGKAQVVVADNFGSPPTGDFNFLAAWFDPTSRSINIQVENGVLNTQVVSAGVNRTVDRDFFLGTNVGSGAFHDGRLDETAIWHRKLSSAERMNLFNGGAGLSFPFVSG